MTDAPKYTLGDLEAAEDSLREGDSGRHSNPGRTRRWNLMAQERVSEIRQYLISTGELPDPRNSPAMIERERVQRLLDQQYPNAESKRIVEFEGVRYQRRYSKIDRFWFGRWQKLD